jgi:biopolymer transport protein ExbD
MEIMMTPMIDVVFLLLIFFLTSSSFEIIEQLMPSGISDQGIQANGQAADVPPPESISDINDCIVKIRTKPGDNQNYTYEFNGTVVEGPQAIFQRLQAIMRVRADVPIIVDPDDQVSIASAVEVYDRARAAGGLRVYFAAR